MLHKIFSGILWSNLSIFLSTQAHFLLQNNKTFHQTLKSRWITIESLCAKKQWANCPVEIIILYLFEEVSFSAKRILFWKIFSFSFINFRLLEGNSYTFYKMLWVTIQLLCKTVLCELPSHILGQNCKCNSSGIFFPFIQITLTKLTKAKKLITRKQITFKLKCKNRGHLGYNKKKSNNLIECHIKNEL